MIMASRLDDMTAKLAEQLAGELSADELVEAVELIELIANDQKYNKFVSFFPEEGEFRRELYPKHIDFFNAGKDFTERAFIAGNRVGKTEAGAFETVCHVTGDYPEWWDGLRFDRPILAWIGGDTATTCRDIIQKKLLGEINDIGSGMLPKESIIEIKTRRNVPEAVETIRIRTKCGGISTIVIKTYEQGRATWQGSEVDWIWVDEECPQDVYGEALIRLMTTNGSVITTFTPLRGVTELVLSFLENDQTSDVKFPKYVQVVAWSDVPHITEEMKEKMLAATPPQLREARSKGVPTVGEGLVYQVDPKHVIVEDFQLPLYFRRLYGMDVGWNNTAAVWGAYDESNDIIYIYSEHKQGLAEPVVHAKAIKARGDKLKGEIDPAARGRSQVDGETLFALYRNEGLLINPANNAVEAGIFAIWERLSTGRLKIFSSCTGLLRELSLYHRDKNGQIVKTNDHLLDAMRYLINAPMSRWSYLVDPRQKKKVVGIHNNMRACT
jgi:phage terminase large subunit-like protein